MYKKSNRKWANEKSRLQCEHDVSEHSFSYQTFSLALFEQFLSIRVWTDFFAGLTSSVVSFCSILFEDKPDKVSVKNIMFDRHLRDTMS